MDIILKKPVVVRTPEDVINRLSSLVDWAQMYPSDTGTFAEIKRILRIELPQAVDQYALAQAEVVIGKDNQRA